MEEVGLLILCWAQARSNGLQTTVVAGEGVDGGASGGGAGFGGEGVPAEMLPGVGGILGGDGCGRTDGGGTIT